MRKKDKTKTIQQMKEVTTSAWFTGSISTDLVICMLLIFAVLLLWVALLLSRVIKLYITEKINPQPFASAAEKAALESLKVVPEPKIKKPSIWEKLMQLKPLEQEKDLMMDHKFDGIAELDNPTPAWFMVLFYGTIIFAFAYMMNYHVLGYGMSQDEEYAAELVQAEEAKIAFLANPANAGMAVNENNIEDNNEPAVLQKGAALYAGRCTPCHGEHGEGIVGPNLTDEYWLHGGTVKEVFKTIKYGVPDKGMVPWEKSLSPQQLSDLTHYVLSLQGTNPAGAKAPQGNKM